MNATRRTRRPAAAAGLFGAPLRADNPLLNDLALFDLDTEPTSAELVHQDGMLELDFALPAPRVEAAPLVLASVPVATYAVHYFDTTAQALAAVDRDEVDEGDVLICDEESVAGVLVGSWVVAVTDDAEEFEVGTVPAAFAEAARFAAEFMA